MKKSFLSLVTFVLLIFSFMFLLIGCGNGEMRNDTQSINQDKEPLNSQAVPETNSPSIKQSVVIPMMWSFYDDARNPRVFYTNSQEVSTDQFKENIKRLKSGNLGMEDINRLNIHMTLKEVNLLIGKENKTISKSPLQLEYILSDGTIIKLDFNTEQGIETLNMQYQVNKDGTETRLQLAPYSEHNGASSFINQ